MNLSSVQRFARHLAASYTAAIPRIIYRSSLSLLVDPRGAQSFVHQVLNAVDLEQDDPVLGSKTVEEIIDTKGADIQIAGPYYSTRTSDARILLELATLAALVRCTQPRLIFEIGTFVGRTTRLFALNSPPDCRVVTLDLPQPAVKHVVGQDFQGTAEAVKITQVHADSRIADYSPWKAQCDIVWVDANHDYEFVLSDTNAAFSLCRPGGWIAWHDYRHSAWWSGVTQVVRRLKTRYPDLCHIRGTTIALLKMPEH